MELNNTIHKAKVTGDRLILENLSTKHSMLIVTPRKDINELLDVIFNRD
jgi:hypothetical protein